jgi:O-antigen ligase
MIFRWKQAKSVIILVLILLALMPAGLFFQNTLEDAYTKLFESPSELLTERYNLIQTAMDIWSHDFLFGCGPGNFMIAIDEPYVRSHYNTAQIVHNAYFYLAAELGLFGLIAFYSIIFIALVRCWKVLRCEDLLIRGLGLAILTGLFGYLLDGITGPFFRHIVIYSQLWIYIGLIVSFKRMLDENIINDHVVSVPAK